MFVLLSYGVETKGESSGATTVLAALLDGSCVAILGVASFYVKEKNTKHCEWRRKPTTNRPAARGVELGSSGDTT